MSQPLNGHGAVDLGAMKQQAQQREALEAQREQITDQLLGERIRAQAAIYFMLVDGPVMTPQGPQPGLNLNAVTCCSRECSAAIMLGASAIARRDGLTGRVTWLDERRAARAARQSAE
jgi:hypothetical protein